MRDAADGQLVAKLWRRVWYRGEGPSIRWGRIQAAEYEAYLTLLVHRAGVATREVVVYSPVGPDVRGFQVLPSAYPEAQSALPCERLHLRQFERDAVVRFQGRFHRLVDPRRSPLQGVRSLPSGARRRIVRTSWLRAAMWSARGASAVGLLV